LIRPYVRLDIYSSDGSLTFLGEAKTRLAVRHVNRLEKKIETVRMREPELLRGRVVTELEQIVSQACSDCWILEIVSIGRCLFAGLTWLM
jgi:hypothetical protein